VKRYPAAVYGVSWTSVMFDVGQNKIKRVPLMDPLRGNESLTGELLAQADTATALLAKLST
jgi:proteasome accessory factor A